MTTSDFQPASRSGRPIPLPPVALRFMGEDDRRLIEVGDELAGVLVEHGLRSDSVVLDVGCGYGRLGLGILHATDHHGPYLGFDILHRQIDWCARSITPSFPNLRFKHLDIRNERYNPTGTIDPVRVAFPARSGGTDICAVFSVFTHLYRPDIERYLDEIRRVLRPGGTAVTTWFLFEEARLPMVTSPAATYPMVHVLDAFTRYAAENNPLRAIAFDENAVRGMVIAARLEVVTIEHGSWAGEPGRTFQDLVVVRRSPADVVIDPEPPGPSLGSRLGSSGRRVRATLETTARRAARLGRRVARRAWRSLGRA